MPENANNKLRMLYAGAKELMRNKAEAGKIVDAADEDDVVAIGEKLASVSVISNPSGFFSQ
ncbi:hypothetical protein ABW20_dc0107564 [Dactylellina cionopaga]|nr:hypothetical protein ABW20_dc0107564 [Dactylellina cionopaga]